MLDLRQIQYFACLFEQRSVTRAARSLGVVQPALSMQISRLEKRLGLRLFQRTARGMIVSKPTRFVAPAATSVTACVRTRPDSATPSFCAAPRGPQSSTHAV